jgi:hypothetical protein
MFFSVYFFPRALLTILRDISHCCAIGIETSVGDVDTGIVTVVGKVDPTEVCQWLKKKTKKSVKVVNPDPAIENHNQVIRVSR